LWEWNDQDFEGTQHFELHSRSGAIEIERYTMHNRQSFHFPPWWGEPAYSHAWRIMFKRDGAEYYLSVPYWLILGLLLSLAFLTWWRGRIRRARRGVDDAET
jgi:hypothetical protein